jgi:hypothetical protein
MQTFWCLCLTDVRHKSVQLMEGIDKPHTGKYKEITNNSNYDVSCTLTSLPVWDFENFKRLIFVVQTVHTNVSGRWRQYFSPKHWYLYDSAITQKNNIVIGMWMFNKQWDIHHHSSFAPSRCVQIHEYLISVWCTIDLFCRLRIQFPTRSVCKCAFNAAFTQTRGTDSKCEVLRQFSAPVRTSFFKGYILR